MPPTANLPYGCFFIFAKMPSQKVMVRMKYRLTKAQNNPNNTHAGRRSTCHALSKTNVKRDLPPISAQVNTLAVMLATRIGNRDAMVRSTINTSRVNTSPAIGALKIPAMAAAAPQPTRSIMVLLSILKSWPRLEPMAEPVNTIGASAPTEPPKPIVIADAITDDQQLCGFRWERFEDMA